MSELEWRHLSEPWRHLADVLTSYAHLPGICVQMDPMKTEIDVMYHSANQQARMEAVDILAEVFGLSAASYSDPVIYASSGEYDGVRMAVWTSTQTGIPDFPDAAATLEGFPAMARQMASFFELIPSRIFVQAKIIDHSSPPHVSLYVTRPVMTDPGPRMPWQERVEVAKQIGDILDLDPPTVSGTSYLQSGVSRRSWSWAQGPLWILHTDMYDPPTAEELVEQALREFDDENVDEH